MESMSGESSTRRNSRERDSTLLAKYAFVCLVPAVALTAFELVVLGRITGLVLALDTIAGALLPFGVLSLVLVFWSPDDRFEDDPGEDGDGPTSDEEPPSAPPGGLGFDWERFEADFRAYARERELVTTRD